MIICKYCGSSSEEGAYFCEKCGKMLAAEDESTRLPARPTPVKTCPSCNAAIQENSSFCSECGARLKESAFHPAPEQHKERAALSPDASAAANAPYSPPIARTAQAARVIREFGGVVYVPANVIGKLAIGSGNGKLILYSDRIEFVPSVTNILKQGQMVIYLSDIASVDFCSVMMMPVGVEIKTRGGASSVFMFSVVSTDSKKTFVETTRQVMAAANGGISG